MVAYSARAEIVRAEAVIIAVERWIGADAIDTGVPRAQVAVTAVERGESAAGCRSNAVVRCAWIVVIADHSGIKAAINAIATVEGAHIIVIAIQSCSRLAS